MANTFAEKDIESSLIAMGVKPASVDSETQTMAVSKLSPGAIVPGATTGMTPGGQGIAPVETKIQAYTAPQNNVAPDMSKAGLVMDPLTGNWMRKNAAGGLESTGEGVNLATGRGFGPTGTPGSPSGVASGTPGGSTTIGQAYAGTGYESGNGALDAAYDQYGNMLLEDMKPVDEQAIREKKLQELQVQIDAVRNYYDRVKAGRIAEETKQGDARLGTGAAIQARRGLLGSTFGAAQTDKINQGTAENINAISSTIEAQRANEIQAILGKAQLMSDEEIAKKEEARKQGSKDYIEFLKGQADRKDERVNSAIASLIATSGEPDDGTIEALAKTLGVSVADLKGRIVSSKEKAATEAAKNAPKLEVIDGIGYERQEDGSYKAVTPGPTPEQEKPLIVGGVAYQKQADGTYKNVTPSEEANDFQFVAATKTQPAGYFNKKTGEFKPIVGSKPPAVPPRSNGPAPAPKPAPLTQATKDMTSQLSQLTGADGFVAPDTYTAARNEWVSAGYNPTDFDSKMKGFVNPNNPNYVIKKQ